MDIGAAVAFKPNVPLTIERPSSRIDMIGMA